MIQSQDPRVQSILPFVNGCCNPFARMPAEMKDEFYKAWGAWQAVQDKIVEEGKTPRLADLDAGLLAVVKGLGGMRSLSEKRALIEDEKWRALKIHLGLS